MFKDEKIRKNYKKKENWKRIPFCCTHIEFSLLETMMKKEDWGNVSGFIKYKLFGLNPEENYKRLIKKGKKEDCVIALKNAILELAKEAQWFHYRYNRDMNQLYREEGLNLKQWIKATNKWHAEMTEKIYETLETCRLVASALNLEDYFDMPSKHMNIDPETATKEEMDKLAEQLRLERTALGYHFE